MGLSGGNRRRLMSIYRAYRSELVQIAVNRGNVVAPTLEDIIHLGGVDAEFIYHNSKKTKIGLRGHNVISYLRSVTVLSREETSDFTYSFSNADNFGGWFVYENGVKVVPNATRDYFIPGESVTFQPTSKKYILYYDLNGKHGITPSDKIVYYYISSSVKTNWLNTPLCNGKYGQAFVRKGQSGFKIISTSTWQGMIKIPDGITGCFGNVSNSKDILRLPKTFNYGGQVAHAYSWDVPFYDKLIYQGTVEDWLKIPFIEWQGEYKSNPVAYTFQFCINDDENDIPTTIVVPEGQTTLYKSFPNCTQFTSIILPSTITRIYTSALREAPITEVKFNGTIKQFTAIQTNTGRPNNNYDWFIGNHTLTCLNENNEEYQPDTIEYNDGTTSISNFLIEYLPQVKHLVFPSGVTSLISAFNNLTNLEGVLQIPDSVTIFHSLFKNCSKITEVIFGDGITAFSGSVNREMTICAGCTSLTKVTLGANISELPVWGAFTNCTSLTEIIVKNPNINFTKYNDTPFTGCNIHTIRYNGTFEQMCLNNNWESHFSNNKSANRTIFSDNTEISADPVIPTGATKVQNKMFYSLTLNSITIPEGVTVIGFGAFSLCTIPSITLPSTLVSINKAAFSQFNTSNPIIVPEGVTNIDNGAFSSCKAPSFTLPSTVTAVNNNAFYGRGNSSPLHLRWAGSQILTYAVNTFGRGTIYIPTGETPNYIAKGYPSEILIEE